MAKMAVFELTGSSKLISRKMRVAENLVFFSHFYKKKNISVRQVTVDLTKKMILYQSISRRNASSFPENKLCRFHEIYFDVNDLTEKFRENENKVR